MTWLTWAGIAFWVLACLSVLLYRLADSPGEEFYAALRKLIYALVSAVVAILVGGVYVIGKMLTR